MLDSCGVSRELVLGLESKLDCSVETFKELRVLRNYLASNKVDLAIINPYKDFFGGLVLTYANFVRNDLKQMDVPVLIFTRTGFDRLTNIAKLVLGTDYKSYLKKPTPVDEFVEYVSGLLEE